MRPNKREFYELMITKFIIRVIPAPKEFGNDFNEKVGANRLGISSHLKVVDILVLV